MNLKKIAFYLLAVVMIVGGGYILFNIGFLLFALVVNTTMSLSGQSDTDTPRVLTRLLGYAAVGALSFFGLKLVGDRTQFKHVLRATLITLPLMTLLVAIGIAFYQRSDAFILGIGALVIIPAMLYVYFKKLPWMYWVSVIYVAVLGVVIVLKDIQI